MEKAYDFRKKLLQVHEKNLSNAKYIVGPDEYMIPQNVGIHMAGNIGIVTETAVNDFIEFLEMSMNISAKISTDKNNAKIKVALAEEVGIDLGEVASYKGFMIQTDGMGICVYGHDERGIAQGLYYLETLMTFAKAPVISFGTIQKKPMFAPRMIHSGYGLDDYPDEYLARVAHEGRDVILVFTKGVNETPNGYLDFNELIQRAAKWGIDVYAYSYMVSNMSPEAPEAYEYYDNTYGRLFRECPGLAGVTLVGESVEFPSKDPNVEKGRYFETAKDGIPSDKPSSGWYPCEDYPVWLNLLKKVIRQYNEKADIVFWSYNWGYQPEELRVKLIENLPTDISLQATFEMFQPKYYGNSRGKCADYTLSFEGPGDYFKSEAIAAKKRGVRLYSMTNTGGLTWDLGVIPYEPMPYQWIRRYEAMVKARDDWGLCGLMESHHYGFTPSIISKLSNLVFLEPRESMEEILEKILKAEFDEENYETTDKGLRLWSEAIKHYTPSIADQYGAFRVGPSYPLSLTRFIKIPSDPKAMFGNGIVDRALIPGISPGTIPLGLRIQDEKESLKKMLEYIEQGLECMEMAPKQNKKLDELINLGKFIRCSVITGIHAKEWHVKKYHLLSTNNAQEYARLLDEMTELLQKELKNVEETIPLVENDSRLGWEPSMLYMTDRWHLEWKMRQIQFLLNTEMGWHRESLALFEEK